MKQKETVSAMQMSMLFLAYGSGSAMINIPSPLAGAAGSGAWISIAISCALGLPLVACMLYMHRLYPDLDFMQYGEKTLGKALMFVIAIPYLCAVLYMLALIVIDIGTFFSSTMLKETNTDAIRALFFFLAAVTARGGIEVMVRMFLLLTVFALLFVIVILFMAAPNYHPEFLLPIMPDGIKPILHGTYISYGFPFAEATLFAMLLQYVRDRDRKALPKPMYAAMLVNGFMLMVCIACTIMAEGPLAGQLKYSIYQLARLIYIQEVIERVESVIGLSLIIVSYTKATIVLYVASRALSSWAKLKNDKLLVMPIAFVCMLLSWTMYDNETNFIEAVGVIWPLLDNVAFTAPMLLIVAVTVIKRATGKLRP
ncbi:endospore germination permease [Cohnella sp. GCM10027633]|uniref:GerAB/ArcD/ProY family transporter n=1 Tax=unclassified Cohnella TaxID=2636738 RepID=UPI00362A0405